MKYNKKLFDNAVADYKKRLSGFRKKDVLVVLEFEDKKAFYSLAPLSMAVHELGSDLHVVVKHGKTVMLDILDDVWKVFDDMKKGVKSSKTKAMKDFIDAAEKKTKGQFIKIFKKPDAVITADGKGFKGSFKVPYHAEWFKEYKWDLLIETAENLWQNCYCLKEGENLNMGFELVPPGKRLELPLEDYLDNFAIIRAMATVAGKKSNIRMAAASCRWSMLEAPERISDLKTTLLGCELDKEVNEPVFKAYKKLSKLMRLSRITFPDATFYIVGKGYPGRHLFGEVIGYPTLDRKTRWGSPAGILYKFDWAPQTSLEKRKPMTRVGFTETLPIDIFIDSCNVDYDELDERNNAVIRIMEKSEFVHVSGETVDGLRSDFNVFLKMVNGKNRWARASGSDVRTKINPEYLKRTGIEAGCMANHPSGEMFVTPEYIEGTVVGDVVISIDQSYRIPKGRPLVIKCDRKGYKIVKGDKTIIAKFNKKKAESWKRILSQEKNKSLPKAITDQKKRNFNYIGEFAVNTNPAARLCDYLIVNEKIARMIHIAMGSGFEPDRATEYHTDVVINAPRQKLDIYGVDKEGNKLWILRKGNLVV